MWFAFLLVRDLTALFTQPPGSRRSSLAWRLTGSRTLRPPGVAMGDVDAARVCGCCIDSSRRRRRCRALALGHNARQSNAVQHLLRRVPVRLPGAAWLALVALHAHHAQARGLTLASDRGSPLLAVATASTGRRIRAPEPSKARAMLPKSSTYSAVPADFLRVPPVELASRRIRQRPGARRAKPLPGPRRAAACGGRLADRPCRASRGSTWG